MEKDNKQCKKMWCFRSNHIQELRRQTILHWTASLRANVQNRNVWALKSLHLARVGQTGPTVFAADIRRITVSRQQVKWRVRLLYLRRLPRAPRTAPWRWSWPWRRRRGQRCSWFRARSTSRKKRLQPGWQHTWLQQRRQTLQ